MVTKAQIDTGPEQPAGDVSLRRLVDHPAIPDAPHCTTNRGGASQRKIVIREATQYDNDGLLELTRLTPMDGVISLRIDRAPDFFSLLRARGTPIVYVAEIAGEVIGCMSAVLHMAYISGVAERVAHLGDLKVHPRFSGTRLALRLIATLDERLRSESIDLCLSLMADGNQRALRLTAGKHGVPGAVSLGCFIVDQLLPLPFRIASRKYRVREAGVHHLPGIASMLNDSSRRKSFGVPVTVGELSSRTGVDGTASFRKLLVAHEAGRLVASLVLEDTQHLRQNVLVGLPMTLRLLLKGLHVLSLVMPGFSVPQIGKPLKTLYVRYAVCLKGSEAAMRELVAAGRVEAFRQRFTFLSFGLHERDPLRAALAGAFRVSFISKALGSNLVSHDRVAILIDQVTFEDFALV